MKTGETCFAYGIEIHNVGHTALVNNDAAAGVVGGRYDGYAIASNVDAKFKAAGINRRKVLFDKFSGFMCNVWKS